MLVRTAAAAALALALLAPPAQAAGLSFSWITPQPQAQALPVGRPFLLLTRFGPGEILQRFYYRLAAGQSVTISAFVPVGAPDVELTVREPDGAEFSLAQAPAGSAPRLGLGLVDLRRVSTYALTATEGSGIYAIFTQPGRSSGEPYALAGDEPPSAGPLGPLGPLGLRTLLQAPVTAARLLLWLWG
jgi:hypothetical protein